VTQVLLADGTGMILPPNRGCVLIFDWLGPCLFRIDPAYTHCVRNAAVGGMLVGKVGKDGHGRVPPSISSKPRAVDGINHFVWAVTDFWRERKHVRWSVAGRVGLLRR
jgi:hypothetical protein